MDNINNTSGALTKAPRKGIRKIKAEAMKPPQEYVDVSGEENHKFFLVYVTDGTEIREECSKELWRKVRGPEPRPGRKLPGYDNKAETEFYIIKDKQGKLVDVDVLPLNKYQRGDAPTDSVGRNVMEITINPSTGQQEITFIPPKTYDTKVLAIMNAIDDLETIAVGDLIDDCEVVQIVGNRLGLEIIRD